MSLLTGDLSNRANRGRDLHLGSQSVGKRNRFIDSVFKTRLGGAQYARYCQKMKAYLNICFTRLRTGCLPKLSKIESFQFAKIAAWRRQAFARPIARELAKIF